MGVAGRATEAGTARYAARCAGRAAPGHFRSGLGLTLSSIGAGTYLGELTDAVDDAYRSALAEAVRLGCNVLDTAVSYRAQRSEMAVGRAVADLLAAGTVGRDELVIASKGGFITHRLVSPANRVQYIYEQFVASGVAEPDELAGGIHCMAPGYLAQQIAWSLRNLDLHTLDIYFIHDPEIQLAFVDRATFRHRLQLAFARLEEEVVSGRIAWYGVATWNGLRRAPMAADHLNLELMVRMAESVVGAGHHFRALQVPLNAIMIEAFAFRNQSLGKRLLPAIAAAQELGLTVMTSASLMQAQLLGRLPDALSQAFPDLDSSAQRALQFVRSLPGVTTALVGMAQLDHVRQNLALAGHPPAPAQAAHLMRSLAH